MEETRPRISAPGSQGIGPAGPVQQTVAWLREFFTSEPTPDVGDEARSGTLLLATHLLHLLDGTGLLNGMGLHSAAVALLRHLEDALDCFACVALVPGAAARWQSGDLRASDAAKLWTPLVTEMSPRGISVAEYRRRLRAQFNDYGHSSPRLCNWNLYLRPVGRDREGGSVHCTVELNRGPVVINRNGHAIDAHLTGHLLEFLILTRKAFAATLAKSADGDTVPVILQGQIVGIMEKHDAHRCQDVIEPPELVGLGSAV